LQKDIKKKEVKELNHDKKARLKKKDKICRSFALMYYFECNVNVDLN